MAPGNDLPDATPLGRSPHRHDRSDISSARRARRTSDARVGAPAMHAAYTGQGRRLFSWPMDWVRSVTQHSPSTHLHPPWLWKPRAQEKHFPAYLRHDRARAHQRRRGVGLDGRVFCRVVCDIIHGR